MQERVGAMTGWVGGWGNQFWGEGCWCCWVGILRQQQQQRVIMPPVHAPYVGASIQEVGPDVPLLLKVGAFAEQDQMRSVIMAASSAGAAGISGEGCRLRGGTT